MPYDISWSFSSIERYDRCAHAFKLKYIDRISEPDVPPKEGKTVRANDRGTSLHEGCELYVSGQVAELNAELSRFAPHLEKARELFALGFIIQEEEWGIDKEWNPTPWATAWGRMKLDLFAKEPQGTRALVVDFKSGKHYGNEVKHADQANLYQAAAFMRFPELKHVVTEFWYLDHGIVSKSSFTRKTLSTAITRYNNRVRTINYDRHFRPNPTQFNCRWCGYSYGNRDCKFSLQEP